MTLYNTARISDHAYYIEEVTDDYLKVSSAYFPMVEASNNVSEYASLRLTPKRVAVKVWRTRDNWNGSGWSEPDKDFFPASYQKQVKTLITEAKDLLRRSEVESEDKDDLDYDIMAFVGKIFKDFSNNELTEDQEEALEL